MFAESRDSNYDRVCAQLFASVCTGGAIANLPSLEGHICPEGAFISIFNEEWCVRDDGVYRDGRKLDTTGSILVARYLLQAGAARLERVWLPYRDLKGGIQFASFIKTHIEDMMAAEFSGRRDALKQRLLSFGAKAHEGEATADLALVVTPLPRIPVLCLFWDGDEEFPPSFKFMFDASAPAYLDLESLAVTLQYIYSRMTRASAEEV